MRAGFIFITGCWALLSACTPLGFGLVDEPVNPVSEYIIGPGDTVNVFVYRSPELSAESSSSAGRTNFDAAGARCGGPG